VTADMSEYIDVLVLAFERDEGTLVLFKGAAQHDEDEAFDRDVTIAVEHGYAQGIYDALAESDGPIVSVPRYLIVRWGDRLWDL
jgi:hypothetical protein